jgi:hypothetical protein
MHNTEQPSPWLYDKFKQRVLLPFETKNNWKLDNWMKTKINPSSLPEEFLQYFSLSYFYSLAPNF